VDASQNYKPEGHENLKHEQLAQVVLYARIAQLTHIAYPARHAQSTQDAQRQEIAQLAPIR
jgi:hypothetical protein